MIDLSKGARVWSFRFLRDDTIRIREHEIVKSTPKTIQIVPWHEMQITNNLKKEDANYLYATYDDAYNDVKNHIHSRTLEVVTYDEHIAAEAKKVSDNRADSKLRAYLKPRSDVAFAGTSINWDNLVEGEDVNLTGKFGRRSVGVWKLNNVDVWSFAYEAHVNHIDPLFQNYASRDKAIAGLIKWIEDKIVYNHT